MDRLPASLALRPTADDIRIGVVDVVGQDVVIRFRFLIVVGNAFDLLHDLDRLDDILHAYGLVLLAAAAEVSRCQNVQEGAIAMEEHGDELDEDDHGEEDQEGHRERLEMAFLSAVPFGHPDVEGVLELVLHHLQQEDDEEPEEVEHEEEEGGVVSQGLQVQLDLGLVAGVGGERVEVLLDELLPELRLVVVQVSHRAALQLLLRDPVWIHQVIPLDFRLVLDAAVVRIFLLVILAVGQRLVVFILVPIPWELRGFTPIQAIVDPVHVLVDTIQLPDNAPLAFLHDAVVA